MLMKWPRSPLRWWTTKVLPAPRWRGAVHLLLVVTAVGLVLGTREIESRTRSPFPLSPTLRYGDSLLPPAPGEDPDALDRVAVPRPFSLRRGETLGGVLGEMGLTPREVHAAVEAIREHVEVRRLRAGEGGVAYFDGSALVNLRLTLEGKGWVELGRDDGSWTSSWHEFVRRTEVRRIRGELDGFLEAAVREAGGEARLAYLMSDVLAWDLDFSRDLRIGDRFEVLWEDVYLDDAYSGPGQILALAYENRGERFDAYRYGDGYYDAEGRPVQKMFLRSPLKFSRVTSRFSRRRYHPVLKIHRPHLGVDYGSPVGTPVRVTAGGVVAFVGRDGQAGKMVKVRHPKGFLTAYLHLSRYAQGMGQGRRVRQGEVIGYVGTTGLSTGPHLDYRVQRNGRWIDPLSLKRVPTDPIPQDELPAFLERRDALRADLSGEAIASP